MADDDKELKDQRVVTMMSPSELEAIDDWMFKNRIRSRGEAIRRLCQIGMEYDRTSWALLRAGMFHAGTVLKAGRVMDSAFADKDCTKDGLRTASVQSSLAGMQAVVDLLARIGTLWIATSPLKAPEDIRELISLAREFREDLEKEGQTDTEKLAKVTDVLRHLGIIKDTPPSDSPSDHNE